MVRNSKLKLFLRFLFLITNLFVVSNAAFYDFNKFLRESIAFELCSRDTYLFCFNVSTVSILSEYSYELSISNDTVCRSAEK